MHGVLVCHDDEQEWKNIASALIVAFVQKTAIVIFIFHFFCKFEMHVVD